MNTITPLIENHLIIFVLTISQIENWFIVNFTVHLQKCGIVGIVSKVVESFQKK